MRFVTTLLCRECFRERIVTQPHAFAPDVPLRNQRNPQHRRVCGRSSLSRGVEGKIIETGALIVD